MSLERVVERASLTSINKRGRGPWNRTLVVYFTQYLTRWMCEGDATEDIESTDTECDVDLVDNQWMLRSNYTDLYAPRQREFGYGQV